MACRAVLEDTAIGDSVAVDGVCLTVSGTEGGGLAFDLSEETLRRTTLGGASAGGRVNLERAATLLTRLGGHLVQGHVDGVAAVVDLTRTDDGGGWLRLRLPGDLTPFCVEKGSITVDGVSLTVATIDGDEIGIALVPHTLAVTSLGGRSAGDGVNVEVDVIARYVESQLRRRRS